MKQKSIAIINSQSPYHSTNGKDALDIALIYGSFEQPVSLFFQGEGVRQLISNQAPESIKVKDYLATLSALEFYDIDNIYVCQTSLKQRSLAADFHISNATVLNESEFSNKLHEHSVILRF